MHAARPRARGRRRVAETDTEVARLKADSRMVEAIEPAVRLYEQPPTDGLEVETSRGDVWIGAEDWAEAFDAPEPNTPHNDARDQAWEALLTIVADKIRDQKCDDAVEEDAHASEDFDAYGTRYPQSQVRRAVAKNRELSRIFRRAWPLLDPADIVGDLWSVPAYLRCALRGFHLRRLPPSSVVTRLPGR